MFNTQILAGSSGQGGETQQSLKFNDDESQYLSWTPAAAGNRKTWTWSGWVKRGNLTSSSHYLFGSSANFLRFEANALELYYFSGSIIFQLTTTQLFRDTSAWYHIVVAYDTTQATAANRIKFFINGVQVTSFSTSSYPSQNSEYNINNATTHYIGFTSATFDGYLSDVHFIDGQALDPTSFGQFTNGYWEKKDYAGTYGTNGFHLTFADDVVSEGFNVATYSGNGGTQSVSGLGLSPDLVWIKTRSVADNHKLTDSVRGATKTLFSNTADNEFTETNALTSFDADGFTIGNDSGNNGSGRTYVAWAWDAGSGSPVSNTDGTITATVKANPDYGFSIISYTGNGVNNATIGTGLNSEAEMVIIKNRTEDSATDSWPVWHKDIGTGKYLSLSTTNAAVTSSVWNDGGFTNNVISISSWNGINKSGTTFIGYAFHSVAGYSSIGSYTGTGAAGNAVNCGFRPAFVMIKRSNNTGNWVIWDTTRLPQSGTIQGSYLNANLNDAEESPSGSNDIEFTDTGFTLQDSGIYSNSSGDTFIYMAFADTREAAFWKDVSGQGNHWTPNNLDYRDSLPDSPANNFAVMNPLDKDATWTLSEGNLKVSLLGVAGDDENIAATMAVPNSKLIYFEAKPNNSLYGAVGIAKLGFAELNPFTGSGATLLYLGGGSNAKIYVDGSIVYDTGATWSLDIIGVAVDMSNSKVWFSKNGSWLGSGTQDPETNTGGFSISPDEVMPYGFKGNSNVTQSFTFNFGQDSTFSGAKPMGAFTDDNSIGNFQYAPPAGYLALCTANLPIPTIIDGSEHFNTVLYTGTGASTLSITGVGFQPSWVWAKKRSAADNHAVADVVRGVTKSLFPNTTGAESTDVNGLQSFDTDGFTIGSGSGSGVWGGNSGATYAAWNWKAGGTAVSNTDGSITSQVSANVDAGFSIVSWTGNAVDNSTIGHSLASPPEMIITKKRNEADSWNTFHKDLTAGSEIFLDLTNAQIDDANNASWGDNHPSSVGASTFAIGYAGDMNGSGKTYIAYCFHSVDGFSKVGSYTGNNNTDGPMVFTGHKPAFVMIKCSSGGGTSWVMYDGERDTYNAVTRNLFANTSAAEATSYAIDFLSNGFKIRSLTSNLNDSGLTYIYLSFASSPFKFANAR